MARRKADEQAEPEAPAEPAAPKPDGELTMAEAVTRANAEQRKVLSREGWVMPG
jgi:hypothetical protein